MFLKFILKNTSELFIIGTLIVLQTINHFCKVIHAVKIAFAQLFEGNLAFYLPHLEQRSGIQSFVQVTPGQLELEQVGDKVKDADEVIFL